MPVIRLELVQALSKDLLTLGRSNTTPPSLDDPMIFVSLATIFAEDPVVTEKLQASTQRVLDAVSTSANRMKDRRERKGKSLLDLMKVGAKGIA